ncbi:hypothetical protein HD554DRAFT_2024866 [Boletus coccyginus]|nr:hypothetical protein HD554DRAFT_2024866 [Boletus coccyginus]
MYANQYGHASPSPGLSNNPFIEDPTTAHARFPALNASSFQQYPNQPQQQYQPPYPSQFYGPGSPYQAQSQAMPPQSQFTSTSYYPAQQPYVRAQIGPQSTGIGAFQPTSGFPQQYPGYPYSAAANTGYLSPQRTNVTPGYLAEFDPYAQQQAQAQAPSQIPPASGTTSSSGVVHPRDVIRIHKSGLEAWETYSWKQLFGACDALKEAWSARKQQAESIVRQYGGHSDPGLFGPDPAFGYDNQVQGWKQVLKDANDYFDTVAASTFQLHEVFNSYRQSGDQASKQRVRESCNAAVKGLPDWPTN